MTNEILSGHHVACVADAVGQMVAVVRCLTTAEDKIADSGAMVELSHAAMPKIKNYLDGTPTKADLRKYVKANLHHMLSILAEVI